MSRTAISTGRKESDNRRLTRNQEKSSTSTQRWKIWKARLSCDREKNYKAVIVTKKEQREFKKWIEKCIKKFR